MKKDSSKTVKTAAKQCKKQDKFILYRERWQQNSKVVAKRCKKQQRWQQKSKNSSETVDSSKADLAAKRLYLYVIESL
jgi:hypothetical protein